MMNNGKAFFPEQAMTRMEALRSYTLDNAYSAFEENIKGSLEIGKLADLVVLTDNLLTARDADLANIQVDYTFVGGEIRYVRDQ